LGTVAVQHLPLKIFLLDNDGYASIRTTQRSYFNGAYVGCDSSTGLGFPDWVKLSEAFDIPAVPIGPAGLGDPDVASLLAAAGPAMFVAHVDPNQTYFPKVTSRIAQDGSMESNPTHFMTPELPHHVARRVFRFGSVAEALKGSL
jgi:acetolactate synthase-1/2/3 large subunit